MSVSQNDFTKAVFDAAKAVPVGLCTPEGTPAGKRFSVYRNNVAVSLSEAIEATFPVIRTLVGDEFFKAMAGVFLRQHAPNSPIMMYYGAELPGFLQSFAPVAHLGYLPDVARVELALCRSYHAADTSPVDPQILQDIAPNDLLNARLHLAPPVQVIRSNWPVASLYHANSNSDAPPPKMQAEDVLITRQEFDPVVSLLPVGGGVFIESLLANATLGEAVKAASIVSGDFDLTACLALLLAGGSIDQITEGTSP